MIVDANDIISRIRPVTDGSLSLDEAVEIVFRLFYSMMSDMVKNDVRIILPKNGGYIPEMSLMEMSDYDFESSFRKPLRLNEPDYFSSLHKAYMVSFRREGLCGSCPVILDTIMLNGIIKRFSSGFKYNGSGGDATWRKYTELVSKGYSDPETAGHVRSVMLILVIAICKAIRNNQRFVFEYPVYDGYTFKFSVGGNDAATDFTDSDKIPNFIAFPEFSGHYYIPADYKRAISLSRGKFNIMDNVFVTTSIELAMMRSKCVIKAYTGKDYGAHGIVESFRFRKFSLIRREPGFRKEFLFVKYLNSPEI